LGVVHEASFFVIFERFTLKEASSIIWNCQTLGVPWQNGEINLKDLS
jgi:hypothetical protein